MKIIGYDKNGTAYLSDCSVFKETHGLALIHIMDRLNEHNMGIAWDHYIHEMLGKGQGQKSVKAQIMETLIEYHGPKDKNYFEEKIDTIIGRHGN